MVSPTTAPPATASSTRQTKNARTSLMMMRKSAHSPAACAVGPLLAAPLMRQHFGYSKADLVEPEPLPARRPIESGVGDLGNRPLAALLEAMPPPSGRNHCGPGL